MSHDVWSLVPALTAIILAFATRQVLLSLFCAVWVGATILADGNVIAGFGRTVSTYIAGSIANPWNATIVTYSLTLGGMIGIITRTGGLGAVAEWLAAHARSPRGGGLAVWIMGLVVFFDDYANTMLVGPTMRPVSDRLRISREKLSYLCDSTSAPVASIAIIATWTAFEMGVIRTSFEASGVDMVVFSAFLRTIPYRFYSILAIAFAGLVVWMGRDFGPMLAAERRSHTTGKVLADGAVPLSTDALTGLGALARGAGRWYTAAIPLAVVVAAVVVGLYLHGRGIVLAGADTMLAGLVRERPFALAAIRESIARGDAATAMLRAAFAGSITAAVLAVATHAASLGDTLAAWLEGAKSFLVAIIILVLAWGLGAISKDLGTAAYVVRILGGSLPAGLLPAAVFLTGCVIAFATGTAYGTTAILMPLAVPLALAAGGSDSYLFAVMGAVFTGAVFGDHCSPISDTTIMSSMACGSDHMDHVRTQMPYALATAVIALAVGFIPAGFGVHPVVSLAAGLATSILLLRVVGRRA